jgi:hypothetical protein
LKPQLLERWRQGGSAGQGIKATEEDKGGRIEILSPDASIRNIKIYPRETVSVSAEFVLSRDYSPQQGFPAQIDLIQLGAPDNRDKIVGGQRFTVDLSRLVLVRSGDKWQYEDNGINPEQVWTSLDYDDSGWRAGVAPFGSRDNPATAVDAGPVNRHHITTYFRHTFDVAEPSFYRSALLRLVRADGAVVYLSGRETYRFNLPPGALSTDTMAPRKLSGLEKEVFFPVTIDPANLRRGENVIAAEIHLNSPQDDDMRFDLELFAHDAEASFPPAVAFAAPPDGAVFQVGETVPVQLEALSGNGKIESVSLYVDGKIVGTRNEPPYEFRWKAGSEGAHRLRAVAVDNHQVQSTSFHTVTVVESVPPLVELVAPRSNLVFTEGQAISVRAEASERNGQIARVEFWVRDMATFVSPSVLLATVRQPQGSPEGPRRQYTALINGLKPGHYMLWAIAVNDHGGSTPSLPVHIMINAPK